MDSFRVVTTIIAIVAGTAAADKISSNMVEAIKASEDEEEE